MKMAVISPWGSGSNSTSGIDVGPTILTKKSKLAKALLARDNQYLEKMAERWKFMKDGFLKYMCVPFLWCFVIAGIIGCFTIAIFQWFVVEQFIFIGILCVPLALSVFWAGTMALFDFTRSESDSYWDNRKKNWFFAYYVWGTMGLIGTLGSGSSVAAAIYFFFCRDPKPPAIGWGILMVPFCLSISIGLIRWTWDLRDQRSR
jgi:hypothetical protein